MELEDPRSHDCSVANSAHSSSSNTFRKILAHRSLALEYKKWELAKFHISQVCDLLGDVRQDRPNVARDGHFTRVRNQYGFTIKKTASKAIRYGIKLLILKRLCQKTVVSAVLTFAYSEFRDMKFKELPLLGIMTESVPWISTNLSENEHWYEQCQKKYNGKYTHKLRNKRLFERDISSSESNTKRLKSIQEQYANESSVINHQIEVPLLSFGDYSLGLY